MEPASLPVIVVLLAAVDFFWHQRELVLVRREFQRQTLPQMQRQIDALKRRLPMAGASPEPPRQKGQAGDSELHEGFRPHPKAELMG